LIHAGRAIAAAFALAGLWACAAPPIQRSPDKPAVATTVRFAGAGGAHTTGGRGGRIVRVTTLAPDGEGSLKAAIELDVPRVIVFEAGGVIDLAGNALGVRNPYVTIAG